MANLSNINNKFIVTDVGTGQAIVGATNAVTGSTLTVGGAATFAGNVTLSSTAPLLYLTNTTSGTGKNWRLSSATNGKFFITQEGVVDAVTIAHTSGNVGIGTNSPDGKLQVTAASSSTSNGNDASYKLYLTNTDTTNNNYSLINFTDSDGGSSSGCIGLQYTDHTNDYGELCFITRGASGYGERMRIDSSGTVSITSGQRPTTGKGGALRVGGDADGTGLTTNTRKIGLITCPSFNNSNGNMSMVVGDTSSTTVAKLILGSAYTGYASPTQISFHTTSTVGAIGTEKMRITSGGNINLGTGSLGQVAYQLRVDSDFDNGFYMSAGSSSSNYAMYIENGAGSELFNVRGDGNVGIGMTAPSSKLVVRTSTDHNFEVEEVGGELRLSALNNARSANIGLQFAASEFNFLTGNVGIGTTAPVGKLEIATTGSTAKPPSLRISNAAALTYLWDIWRDNTTGFLNIGSTTDGTDHGAHVTIKDGSGYVGIGTTSPAKILDVARAATTFDAASTDEGAVIRLTNPSQFENGYDGNGFLGGIEFFSGDSSEGGPAVFGAIKQRMLNPFNDTAMCFFTAPSNATLEERIRIDTTGRTIIHTGKDNFTVPAYTPAQGYPLHVQGITNQCLISIGKKGQTTGSQGMFVGLDTTTSYLWNRDDLGITFGTNDTTKMVILKGGNVGIGTSGPQTKLHVDGANFNTSSKTEFKITDHGNNTNLNDVQSVIRMNGRYWSEDDNTAVTTEIRSLKGAANGTTGSIMSFAVQASGGSTDISGNEAMRITSAGDVLISKTAIGLGTAGTEFRANGQSIFVADGDNAIDLNRLTNDGGVALFRQAGTVVGSISVTGSATSYNESSDYRLKEDLKDFAGLDMVSKIPVYNFKWKIDESRSYGVMAHELEEVLPQAVVGEKDAEEMQGVDYSKIVPLLVKSIQELKAEVDLLKNK